MEQLTNNQYMGGNNMSYMIGVDVGGTFTDFSVFDQETGEFSIIRTVLHRQTRPRQL